jgi:putative hemolysin
MNLTLGFLLIVGLCVGLSFLLSGMEAGVFALSRLRIRQQMRSGKRRAVLLHGYLENPENFLWTIFIGNTLATFAALSLIIVALHQALGGRWFVILLVFAGVTFLFYALCDLLPKMLFRLFPNRLCLLLVVPFRFIHLVLSPLVALLAWFSNVLLRLTGGKSFKGHLFGSRSELRLAMQESGQALTSEERAMINRVLDLQNATVRSITVPFARVISVTTETPAEEVLNLCRQHQLTRLPVWRVQNDLKSIVGILSLRTFLYSQDFDSSKTAAAYLEPALYVQEELRLDEAMRRMQRSGQRLAIVLGLDQRELGIVSLQDILKLIFGEVSL